MDLEIQCGDNNSSAKVLNVEDYDSKNFKIKILAKNWPVSIVEVDEISPDLVGSSYFEISGTYDATFYAIIPKEVCNDESIIPLGSSYVNGYEVELIDFEVHDDITSNCIWDKSKLEKYIQKNFSQVVGQPKICKIICR